MENDDDDGWVVGEWPSGSIWSRDEEFIAAVEPVLKGGFRDKEKTARRVAMMSAAPELMKACQALMDAINAPRYGDDDIWDDLRGWGHEEGGPIALAEKAIAKATGQ
jgi:hypothetical protein